MVASTHSSALLRELTTHLLLVERGKPSPAGPVAELLFATADALDAEGNTDGGLLVRSRALRIVGLSVVPGALLDALGAMADELLARRVAVEAKTRPTFGADLVGTVVEFLEDAAEGLAAADVTLLTADGADVGAEDVNALFRVFHSLKGAAGFLSLEDIAVLAHAAESLLNLVRDGCCPLKGATLEALFEASDAMRRLLGHVRAAIESGSPVAEDAGLRAVIGRLEARVAAAPPGSLRPASTGYRAAAPQRERRERVAEAGGPRTLAPSSFGPEFQAELGGFEAQAEAAGGVATAVASGVAGDGAAATRIRQTLKVDVERIDSLVEMIGELVIAETMVAFAPEITSLGSVSVKKHMGHLGKISRDLQDAALRLRMVSVAPLFQKMARLVRELSRQTGKDVAIVTEGETTEMDRSMVERIEEPLVHLIRNAVDHGVEAATKRAAANKPARATIRLAARHEGGSAVVELSDDGAGLDDAAILHRASTKKLIEAGAQLTRQEILSLVFLPGFSTKSEVTDLSGRGVGLDVVKKNIESLRGRVTLTSEVGHGTMFRLVLPLTLAIIDGMLIACGREKFILPSLSIVEALQPQPGMLSTVSGRHEIVDVRGEILPLVRLGRLFDVPGTIDDPLRALIVVVESSGRRVALLVDAVLAQQKVVLKPLDAGLAELEYFSGAAILSSGRVGLVVHVDRLHGGARALGAGSPAASAVGRREEPS